MDPTDPILVYRERESLLAGAYLVTDSLQEREEKGRGLGSFFDENVTFGGSGDPDAVLAASLYSIAMLAREVAALAGGTAQEVIQEHRRRNREELLAAEALEPLRNDDP